MSGALAKQPGVAGAVQLWQDKGEAVWVQQPRRRSCVRVCCLSQLSCCCRHLSDYLTTCKEDVVLLQEVWVDADAQLLIASGRAAGLVHATHFRCVPGFMFCRVGMQGFRAGSDEAAANHMFPRQCDSVQHVRGPPKPRTLNLRHPALLHPTCNTQTHTGLACSAQAW